MTSPHPTAFQRLGSGVAALIDTRRAATWPGGVVSFTFDDYPRSAWLEGDRILADHGARGTFYAASGLLGTGGTQGPVATPQDLRATHEAGHEIGCHTRSHLNCAQASTVALESEVRANAAALAPHLDGRPLTSFAYPFGAVSPRAARLMRRRFSTARGIRPGINRGPIDTGELRANRIYDRDFDAGRLRSLIEENQAIGGWLIFYTHDVREQPSDYGCRPSQLAAIVAHAAEHSRILPVGDVSRRPRGWA
jgi:peptidoglycan/xylan/chitin deacetylase (PgdA/CDA1 family)